MLDSRNAILDRAQYRFLPCAEPSPVLYDTNLARTTLRPNQEAHLTPSFCSSFASCCQPARVCIIQQNQSPFLSRVTSGRLLHPIELDGSGVAEGQAGDAGGGNVGLGDKAVGALNHRAGKEL